MIARRATGWFAFAALLVVSACALDRYAHWRLDHQLDQTATAALAARLHGASPYQWDLRQKQAVIAGHAFGPATSRFDETGLQIAATSAGSIELGLTIDRPLDLVHFARLQVDGSLPSTTAVAILIRQHLDAPECRSEPTTASADGIDIDLRHLQWQCAGQPYAMPTRAAMLRLQFDLRKDQRVELRRTVLHQTTLNTVPENPASIAVHAMRDLHPSSNAFSRLAAETREDARPLIEISTDGRVEQTLALRDTLTTEIPGAITIRDGQSTRVLAQAREQTWPPVAAAPRVAWLGVVAWFFLLLGVRIFPPRLPHLRAAAEVIASLGGLLWYAFAGDGSDLDAALALISLGFAASLALRPPPQRWRIIGTAASWSLPALSVVAAVLLAAWLGDTASSVAAHDEYARYVVRYIAWAAVQQYLICVIVFDRVSQLLGTNRWSVAVVAILFTLLHAPNAMLMQLTLFGGLLWLANWQRYRALLPNIVAHAICGVLLARMLPGDWLRSAEVGMRFFGSL